MQAWLANVNPRFIDRGDVDDFFYDFFWDCHSGAFGMDMMETDEIPAVPPLEEGGLGSQLDNPILLTESQLGEAFLVTQIIEGPSLTLLPPAEVIQEDLLPDTEPPPPLLPPDMEHLREETAELETQPPPDEGQSSSKVPESEEEVLMSVPPPPEDKEPEEPACNCPQCQEASEECIGVVYPTKVKCLVCYATINPSEEDDDDEEADERMTTDTSYEGRVLETIPEAGVEDLLSNSKVDGGSGTEQETSGVVVGDKGASESEGTSRSKNAPKQSTAETATEEHPHINLPIIFEILDCCMDEVDLDKNSELLNTVPLCVPCHSVVTDAVVIFQEIKKLEKTLGNLRETIKDQFVQSFEANFCKKKKDITEIVGLLSQIDATRIVIVSDISDRISAAQIISSLKGAKRGQRGGAKRKKTIVSKSALYPQVTLEPLDRSKKRRRTRTQKVKPEFDESGVKKECTSDLDDNHADIEYAYDDDEDEEVSYQQTHSGRIVKKPNYKKYLEEEDEEEEEEEEVKPEGLEDETPESPRSEPEWSPGHTDDEGGDEDFDSEDDSSGDSEVDLDSDEELEGKRRLGRIDELGEEFMGEGEGFVDLVTGEKVVRPARRKKQGIRVKCPECPRTFADEGRKDVHIKRKHQPGGAEAQIYSCDKCSKKFRRPGLLRKHLEKQHGEVPEGGSQEDEGDRKKHMCDFCGQKYRNASELRIHVRLHTGETPYQCEHCDKSFVSSLKREFHIEQSHWEIPPLKCEFCAKAFFRQHRLRIHRISHTGEKAYLCEICSQSFSHPTYLKYHQGQHAELNLETFKCKDCGKVFANPTNLRLHVKTVHLKQFRFNCEVCNMGFTHMSHKRIHMRGHTGERPYKCDLCGEAFRYRDRLRIHMRGHTGERPFVCEMCKKGFASRSKLKRHEKIHEKNQPPRLQSVEEIEQAMRHRCDDCGKGFAEPQHLSAHRRYCQRKTAGDKEERKSNKANQSAKMRAAAAVPKIDTITLHQPIPPQQPPQMLVPVPVNYSYPVTYAYEVPQSYHQQPPTGVREYPYN